MNYYQITFNNLEGFDPSLIHAIITTRLGLTDWWHYVPSSYIVETASTCHFMSSKIIEVFPGLSFIITKIDINDYNGYLDKRAWTWLEQKIQRNRSKLPPINYVPYAPSPLRSLLSGYKPSTPVNNAASERLLDYLKGKK